jgi:putative flavoprotein involved in K+ transport
MVSVAYGTIEEDSEPHERLACLGWRTGAPLPAGDRSCQHHLGPAALSIRKQERRMSEQVEERDIVIVGGGAAGLATAGMLARKGLPALVLEAGSLPGASWRDRYDRVRLHTPRSLSSLPDFRIPRSCGRWVARDDLLEYYSSYAKARELEVRTEVRVQRIDSGQSGWRLATTAGPLVAKTVVVATGECIHGYIPDWSGRETYQGDLIHSLAYRNSVAYRGRDVLVVGAGNSGAEIATEVAEGGARRTRLSVRTPPQILPRTAAGVPVQFLLLAISRLPERWFDAIVAAGQRFIIPDLYEQGLPRPALGMTASMALTGTVPIIDVGIADAVRSEAVEVVAAVKAFDGPDVILEDGSRIVPDAVIAATGFLPGLDELVGHLEVLLPNGRPIHTNGDPARPGLWFIGFRGARVGQLYQLGVAAKKISARIAAGV